MQGDGSLAPSQSQDRFSRNYNDGIGQGSAADPLIITGADRADKSTKDLRVAVAAPVRAPHPKILAGIEEVALRYAAHPGLRAAGLSVTDWLTLYRANIEIESGYDPRAVSAKGAIGLGQLMPDTATALGVDAADWRQNLDGSARYLAMMLAEFGDLRLALAAYNAGPEAVRKHGGIPPYPETEAHVRRVLATAARLEGET